MNKLCVSGFLTLRLTLNILLTFSKIISSQLRFLTWELSEHVIILILP